MGYRKCKQLIISCQYVKYGIIPEIVGFVWIICYLSYSIQQVWRLIANLFYGNQEGIYLMVDSVDSKSNENPA